MWKEMLLVVIGGIGWYMLSLRCLGFFRLRCLGGIRYKGLYFRSEVLVGDLDLVLWV